MPSPGGAGCQWVLVLDRSGRTKAERAVGAAGDAVAWLRAAPDGGIFALVHRTTDAGTGASLVLVASDRPVGE